MSGEQGQQESAHLLTKLNATLVSIVKQEWTTTWTSFVSEICQSAMTGQSRCENVLKILRLLSEEVFDFSKNTMLQKQQAELKSSMTNEFQSIYKLCEYVVNEGVSNPQNIQGALIRECLKTLQVFLSWIPLGYIFQTDLVQKILTNLVCPTSTRIEAIKLFQEISAVSLADEEESVRNQYKETICMWLCIFIE